MHPYGSKAKGMGGQHHIFKDAASILHKGACTAICQNQNHGRRTIVGSVLLPITSAFSFAISCLYLGSVIAIMVGD